jgi:hypothetical protein
MAAFFPCRDWTRKAANRVRFDPFHKPSAPQFARIAAVGSPNPRLFQRIQTERPYESQETKAACRTPRRLLGTRNRVAVPDCDIRCRPQTIANPHFSLA